MRQRRVCRARDANRSKRAKWRMSVQIAGKKANQKTRAVYKYAGQTPAWQGKPAEACDRKRL